MSDEKSDAIEEFDKKMAEEAKFDSLRKETSRNRAVLDHTKTKAQLEQQQMDAQDLEIIKNANFGTQSKSTLEAIQKDNEEYLEAAKNKLRFIVDDVPGDIGFNTTVPFFRKNIIFVGAQSGEGKSTAVANIAFHMLRQKNPATGKPARTLVITNEERKEDVYNRVTCLCKGWSYHNHDKFTDEQKKAFTESIPILSQRLTVVDNVHEGAHGVTTTIEGFEGMMENLIANNEIYDAIVIDYYQNFISSKRDPTLDEFKVQARLTRALDKYKNVYPAPFVVMGQINAPDENGNPIFPYRIQGRKLIMTVATCVMEMIVDKVNRSTRFKFWKSRFNEAVGKSVEVGYDKGRFVQYTEEFRRRVQTELDRVAADRLARQTDQENGAAMKAAMQEGNDGPESGNNP